MLDVQTFRFPKCPTCFWYLTILLVFVLWPVQCKPTISAVASLALTLWRMGFKTTVSYERLTSHTRPRFKLTKYYLCSLLVDWSKVDTRHSTATWHYWVEKEDNRDSTVPFKLWVTSECCIAAVIHTDTFGWSFYSVGINHASVNHEVSGQAHENDVLLSPTRSAVQSRTWTLPDSFWVVQISNVIDKSNDFTQWEGKRACQYLHD